MSKKDKSKKHNQVSIEQELITDIRSLIDSARQRAAVAVNAELTLLYLKLGERINRDILNHKRAEYGKQILANLASELTRVYGRGWSLSLLRYCLKAADIYNNSEIQHTVCVEFSWSHIKLFIAIDDPLKRSFYQEMCKLEHWSVRQLKERIQSMLYERTAISRKPEKTIARDLKELQDQGIMSPELAFRDPYILDFLGLSDSYSERELESAILHELQRFITELGTDFAFLARQKRITLDMRDYYIDLLFYHRRLKRLIAIDLKLGEFEAAYKGQMELYLRWLEKYEKVEGENSPIGLILCTGKNHQHIELLELDKSNIRVAEYLTSLPPMKVLKTKLQQSIEAARQRLGSNNDEQEENEG